MLDGLLGHSPHEPLLWREIAVRLLLSTLLGCVVALIHYVTRAPEENGNAGGNTSTRGFAATLILLSLLLAMVVIIVEGNVARAFSLAGIMAIVRFRTVVENTRDSVFVICAVVIGMATGAGFLEVSLVGLPLVAVVAYITQHGMTRKPGATTTLKIRTGLANEQTARVEELLRLYTDSWTVVGSSTAKQGAALDVVYHVRLKPQTDMLQIIKEFNRIEGIQEVEWKSNT